MSILPSTNVINDIEQQIRRRVFLSEGGDIGMVRTLCQKMVFTAVLDSLKPDPPLPPAGKDGKRNSNTLSQRAQAIKHRTAARGYIVSKSMEFETGIGFGAAWEILRWIGTVDISVNKFVEGLLGWWEECDEDPDLANSRIRTVAKMLEWGDVDIELDLEGDDWRNPEAIAA